MDVFDAFEKKCLKIAGVAFVIWVISMVILILGLEHLFLNPILGIFLMLVAPLTMSVALSVILIRSLLHWYNQFSRESMLLFMVIIGVIIGSWRITYPSTLETLAYIDFVIRFLLTAFTLIGISKKFGWGYLVLMGQTAYYLIILPLTTFLDPTRSCSLGSWLIVITFELLYCYFGYYFYMSKSYFSKNST